MEIGAREAVQFATLLCSIAGAFFVVKSQLARALMDLQTAAQDIDLLKDQIGQNRREDMSEIYSKLDAMDHRVDAVTATEAVMQSQLNTLCDISSVDRLEKTNKQMATVIADIQAIRRENERQQGQFESFRDEYLSAHNHSHKYIPPPKVE